MNILNINLYFDPASVGENLVKAINARGDHAARHLSPACGFHGTTPYTDVLFDICPESELNDLFDWADILHFNQYDWSYDGRSVNGIETVQKITGRIHPRHKIVYHGHGGYWLLNPETQIQRNKEMGAYMATCSPMDIAVLGDNATWLPNILNTDSVKPNWGRDFHGELTVGMAANNTAGIYKGSPMAEYMVGDLKRHFDYPLRFELISGLMREPALKRRNAHHFTIDNWTQGFTGMSGFEGLTLGHVVFGRFDPMVREAWESFAPDMIPIVDVKGFDTCARALREYCDNRESLIEKAHAGPEWLVKWYNDDRILDMWIKFYERVMGDKTTAISNHYVQKMFNDEAAGERPEGIDLLDVIMGNSEYDEFERGEILKLLKNTDIDTSGKTLDAGCGIGRNISVLRDAGFTDIEAVDFSPVMIGEFKKNHPDVPVMYADLSRLTEIENDRYTTAFVVYVFIHITDDATLQKAICELERVTTGQIIIGQVMDPENKPNHDSCKGREMFELIPMFKKKKLHHFYKDVYQFEGKHHDWTNKISFAVFK